MREYRSYSCPKAARSPSRAAATHIASSEISDANCSLTGPGSRPAASRSLLSPDLAMRKIPTIMIDVGRAGSVNNSRLVGNPETEVSHTTSESIVNRRAAAGAADKPTKNPLKPLRNLVLESVEEKRGCF